MATTEAIKLHLISQIASLNDDAILSHLENVLNKLVVVKTQTLKKTNTPRKKKRDPQISESRKSFLLKGLPERENFEQWVADWEDSRKDRDMPFRN